MFNSYDYFAEICAKNKLTVAGNYKFCRVTGLGNLEEVIQNFKREQAYFCIDDTNDGTTFQGAGGGYFERRMYIVYIMKKYPLNDMQAQHAALEECRRIYRSVCSKLVFDRSRLLNSQIYLNTDRIPYYEMEGYAISGVTGLYTMISIDEPVNLCYNANDWTE
ncbi:MAG: hypothetical protein LBV74_01115 [Tannerella sp.]|jgi:hypothetical protein|nr:hypothetical protein [Tannerella sp.]